MTPREIIIEQLSVIDDEEFEISLIADIYNRYNPKIIDKSKKWVFENKSKFDSLESMSSSNPFLELRTKFVDVTFKLNLEVQEFTDPDLIEHSNLLLSDERRDFAKLYQELNPDFIEWLKKEIQK